MAGKLVPNIMQPSRPNACLSADTFPEPRQRNFRAIFRIKEHAFVTPSASEAIEHIARFVAKPDDTRSRLAVGQLQPGAIRFRPAQVNNLRLRAARQEQQG